MALLTGLQPICMCPIRRLVILVARSWLMNLAILVVCRGTGVDSKKYV